MMNAALRHEARLEPLSPRERRREAPSAQRWGEGPVTAGNHPWRLAPVRPSLAARSWQRVMPLASCKRCLSPSSGAARHLLPEGEGKNAERIES
jgi:hypothetical protein